MEVILFDDVKGLGRQGDVVKVAEGYFRNFIRPKGLGDEATPVNMKRYESMKKKQVELAAERLSEARDLAKKLEAVRVTVKAKAGEGDKLFGSVTQQDIAEALATQGFTVDKRHIEVGEHIKRLGEFPIYIQIHPEVKGQFTLVVERL
jgi:large subunit ribosomal protein L9